MMRVLFLALLLALAACSAVEQSASDVVFDQAASAYCAAETHYNVAPCFKKGPGQ